MKKLSTSNWLFLFYLVDSKSENHWGKLAHNICKDTAAAMELGLSKMLMSAFILKYHKMLLMSHFDKTVIKIVITTKSPPTNMDQESKYCIMGIKDN